MSGFPNFTLYRLALMIFTLIGLILSIVVTLTLQGAEDETVRRAALPIGGFFALASAGFWIGAETLRGLMRLPAGQSDKVNNQYQSDNVVDEISFVTTSPLNTHIAADQIFRKGFEAFRRRDYQSAIRLLTEVIHLNPDHVQAYHYRGLTYRKLGDENLAQRDRQKANRLRRERES
ncbi:MAG TPA: tetratricopeptide repeat protein [Aggregatilineales bacterium]|nr:tetratricopeptide repeat protein [Aggregatilineales bacterium]